MMNVNVQNTNQVMQKTAAVGFLPSVAPKQVTKQSEGTSLVDQHVVEGEKEEGKAPPARAGLLSTPQPSRSPQQGQQLQQRTQTNNNYSLLDDMRRGDGFGAQEQGETQVDDNPLMPSPQQMQQAQRQGQAAASVLGQPRQKISQGDIFNQPWAAEAEEGEDVERAGLQSQGGPQTNQQNTADQASTRYNNSWQTRDSAWSAQGADGAKKAEMPKPTFDTGRLIQLQYLANQGRDLASNLIMSAAEKAIALKEKFLRNFFRLVDIEYKQFVKSDEAVYSRKNLREILAALGETLNPFSAKKKKEDKTSEKKPFDKLKQRLAGRTLKIFDDPTEEQEQQEKEREPLELVW